MLLGRNRADTNLTEHCFMFVIFGEFIEVSWLFGYSQLSTCYANQTKI